MADGVVLLLLVILIRSYPPTFLDATWYMSSLSLLLSLRITPSMMLFPRLFRCHPFHARDQTRPPTRTMFSRKFSPKSSSISFTSCAGVNSPSYLLPSISSALKSVSCPSSNSFSLYLLLSESLSLLLKSQLPLNYQ